MNEANPVVVRCDASGFPEPSFTWTKDGQFLSQSKQLNIPKGHRNNAGMYVCTASNGVGRDKRAEAFVTVQCKSLANRDSSFGMTSLCNENSISNCYVIPSLLSSETIGQHVWCPS